MGTMRRESSRERHCRRYNHTVDICGIRTTGSLTMWAFVLCGHMYTLRHGTGESARSVLRIMGRRRVEAGGGRGRGCRWSGRTQWNHLRHRLNGIGIGVRVSCNVVQRVACLRRDWGSELRWH